MIDLYQPSPAFELSSINPRCMTVEGFLRVANIAHQVIIDDSNEQSLSYNMPMIRDNGISISGCDNILHYLQSKLEFSMDGHLSQQQQVLQHCAKRMLNEHLYWALLYSRWAEESCNNTLTKHLFIDVPPPLSGIKAKKLRKYYLQQLDAQGLGKNDANAVYQQAEKDLESLAAILSDRQWFGGDFVSQLDLYAQAYLTQIMISELASPLQKLVQKHGNLTDYQIRAKAVMFPEKAQKKLQVPGSRAKLDDELTTS